MRTDDSVWTRYQPGYVDSYYVPYLREVTTDAWGNKVEINNWKGPMPKSTVQPELVRINQGLRFMRLFSDWDCPGGWQKDPTNLGYCVQAPLRHEPVFYTDKAFIPLKQYFDGPADIGGVVERNQGPRRISQQTDMRSVNPITGAYTIYYEPIQSAARTRYVNPTPGPEKYDTSWNKSRQSSYAQMATKESYLG